MKKFVFAVASAALLVSGAITASENPVERSGRYLSYHYTYVEDKGGAGAFFFEPALAASETVALGAMRALLTNAYHVDLQNARQPYLVDGSVRFVTGDGVFDCLAAKDATLHVMSIAVVRRQFGK